jgi:hypothetical protein
MMKTVTRPLRLNDDNDEKDATRQDEEEKQG